MRIKSQTYVVSSSFQPKKMKRLRERGPLSGLRSPWQTFSVTTMLSIPFPPPRRQQPLLPKSRRIKLVSRDRGQNAPAPSKIVQQPMSKRRQMRRKKMTTVQLRMRLAGFLLQLKTTRSFSLFVSIPLQVEKYTDFVGWRFIKLIVGKYVLLY